MKKLSIALTLLSSLAFAGTAFADHGPRRDRGDADGRAPIVDHRLDDARFGQPMPGPSLKQHGLAGRWQLVTAQATPFRRGTFSVALPMRASYDQIKLVSSSRGLDILGVEITYARGRKELVRADRDGVVAIDLGRGKATSIAVRYVNRGAGRGASIQVLAKDDAKVGFIGLRGR